MNTAIPQASLQIVGDELAVTLNDARVLLEQYAEGEGGSQALERVSTLLHTVRGVLRITETHGASLLAEEMEQTCAHLARLKRQDAGIEEPLEALMRAAVQLPAYVERVLSGGRDIPMVLLPLLNDLRAARGRPLLSESTLLLLNVGARPGPGQLPTRSAPSGEDISRLCQELRPRFQLALLGWIRGDDVEGNLRQMFDVAARLERAAAVEPVHQLWWVAAGVLEALLDGCLEPSVSLKRLMGQVDREIKRLRTLGEAEFARTAPTDITNNLLYYVARVRGGSARVEAIRAAFNLSGVIPGDAQVEQARRRLSAPSARLMQTVAQAIREDLARVKDVLDIFVRTGMERVEELTPQLELLKKIGDTLGVLGLGELREIVQARREELQEVIGQGCRPEETLLLSMAAALLNVEDRLEADLISTITPREEDSTVVSLDAGETRSPELAQVTVAVMRECLVNLARVKDAVAQVIDRKGGITVLDSIPEQLQGIVAGLMMLGKERAAGVVEGLQKAIRSVVHDGRGGDEGRLDRLADATVSIEYYLETLQAGRSDPHYMLDNAERCLARIEVSAGGFVPADEGAAAGTPGSEPAAYEPTQVISIAPPSEVRRPVLVFSGGRERLEPELIELFIEEAREEIVSIERNFQAWGRDDTDGSALSSLRRSFHTLKGSGRMVGADRIGDFCWHVERLLNRLIDGTVQRIDPIMALLGRCIAVLPGLLDQLETGTEPDTDCELLIDELQKAAQPGTAEQETVVEPAADGQVLQEPPSEPVVEVVSESLTPVVPEIAPVAAVEVAVTPAILDPVLLDILTREVVGHLGVLRDFVLACAPAGGTCMVTEALYRSCHTLNGSMAMAHVEIAMPLTEALNNLVSLAYNRPARLPPGSLDTLRDTTARLEALLVWLAEPWRPLPGTADLEQRLADHLHVLEQPAEELLEQTSDLAPGTDEGAPDTVDAAEASIVVEELALPEVIDLSEPEPEAEPVAEPKSGRQLEPEPEPESEPISVSTLAAEPLLVLPFDPEIAAIFAEEAAELLEAADTAVARLSESAGDGQAMADLQRYLHTLKGGARMAGLTVMGDFSHEIETLLIRLSEGLITRTAAVDELLQASLDELHLLREDVVAGEQRPLPAQIAARVHMLLHPATDLLPVEVAVAEPVQPDIPVRSPDDIEPAITELPVIGTMTAEPPPQEPFFETLVEPAGEDTAEAAEVPAISLPALDRIGELARELEQPASPIPATAEPPLLRQGTPERRETARVDSVLLDQMLNDAGELSIFQSRLSQQASLIQFNLEELGATVVRLGEQLRKLELETEAQILFRHQNEVGGRTDFDPLELDRYSTIQQLSRGLAESATDVNSIKDLLQNMARDTEALLVQQSRTVTELQDGLMRTRMVPFHQHGPRFARLVRQSALEHGKRAELNLQGGGELDRQVLDRMLGPFEHILRNAVVHGIESPDERELAGKPATGNIFVNLRRDGSEAVVEIADDGRGLDFGAIRRKAAALGFIESGTAVSDEEAARFILRPGFSTADRLTQAAGRGIGMDVVSSEVAKLGGSLHIDSVPGRGTTFTVRLPFTLAVTQALIVRVGTELYALPLPTVEGVIRMSRAELMARLATPQPSVDYGGQAYRLRHLGEYLGLGALRIAEEQSRVSVILVRAGEQSTALVVEEMQDSREVVVKPVGPQLATIRGIAGATILGDGRIAVILDMGILVRNTQPDAGMKVPPTETAPKGPLALVVDDSITMRRVTQRLLERNGFRVVTARDGVEAIGVLQDNRPDIILLDIEMPRMDGYEFAKHVRNNPDTATVPIIMITSRVSDKHRARAIEVGVNDYLGKPYQERGLLQAVRQQLPGV